MCYLENASKRILGKLDFIAQNWVKLVLRGRGHGTYFGAQISNQLMEFMSAQPELLESLCHSVLHYYIKTSEVKWNLNLLNVRLKQDLQSNR